jgi:hypothetical protein
MERIAAEPSARFGVALYPLVSKLSDMQPPPGSRPRVSVSSRAGDYPMSSNPSTHMDKSAPHLKHHDPWVENAQETVTKEPYERWIPIRGQRYIVAHPDQR